MNSLSNQNYSLRIQNSNKNNLGKKVEMGDQIFETSAENVFGMDEDE